MICLIPVPLQEPNSTLLQDAGHANQIFFDLLDPLVELGLIDLEDTRFANTLDVHQVDC